MSVSQWQNSLLLRPFINCNFSPMSNLNSWPHYFVLAASRGHTSSYHNIISKYYGWAVMPLPSIDTAEGGAWAQPIIMNNYADIVGMHFVTVARTREMSRCQACQGEAGNSLRIKDLPHRPLNLLFDWFVHVTSSVLLHPLSRPPPSVRNHLSGRVCGQLGASRVPDY